MKHFQLVVPNTTPANFANDLASDMVNLPPAGIILSRNEGLEYVEISAEKSRVIPPGVDCSHHRLEIYGYTLRVSQLDPGFPQRKRLAFLGYGRTLGAVIRAEMREMTSTQIRFLGTCEDYMASYMSLWLRQAVTVYGARPVDPMGMKAIDIVQPAQLVGMGTGEDSEGRPSQNPLTDARFAIREFKALVERQTYKDIVVDGKPRENVARALLQTFLKSRSYREVATRGGRSDLLAFVAQGRFLYETKIWRGTAYFRQGLRQIEEYVIGESDDQKLLGIFYIVFDPTKSREAETHLGGEFCTEAICGRDVEVIVVNLSLPKPSKKPS